MARSRTRVRYNPTGTLLINPRKKGKKSRRVRKNGGALSKLLGRLSGRGKVKRKVRRNAYQVNPLTINPSHSKSRKVRRNAYTINPHKRGGKRKNPVMVNPIRIRRRRRNPGMLGNVHKSAMSMMGKIPLVGGFLSAVVGVGGAVFGGAAGVLPTAYFLPWLSKKVDVPDMVKPFAFSLGGAAISGLVSLLPQFPYKQQAIVGIAAAGGAVDTYRKLTGKSQDLGEVGSLLGDGNDLGDENLGDEDLGEELDALGVDDMGEPGVASEWAECELGDADYCGDDLSADEIEAAALGRRHYFSVYGDMDGDLGRKAVRGPHRRSGYAGRRGGQWGWLIYWIGMDNFQELSKLPPEQRRHHIARLRADARKIAAKLISSGNEPTVEQAQMDGLLIAA